jgi:hypothetical protein
VSLRPLFPFSLLFAVTFLSLPHVQAATSPIPNATPVPTPTSVPVPIPKPIPGVPTPRVFTALYVWEQDRWMIGQSASLHQPILVNLAAQTNLPGWTVPVTSAMVELFRGVPRHDGIPGDVQPATHSMSHFRMTLVAQSHGYVHFRRRLAFSSRAMIGQFFALVRTNAVAGGHLEQYLSFTIRA